MSDLISNIASFFTGIVRHCQYRTNHRVVDDAMIESYQELEAKGQLLEYSEGQRNLVIERYQEFRIAHIEFDDQGQYWDRQQLNTLEKEFVPEPGRDDAEEGVLLVCFVHGWNNNARYDNGNLQSLRAVLLDIQATEKKMSEISNRRPRRVIGIYLSWRGLAHRWLILKRLTFWNRKRTAHKVGRGDLVSALSRIEQMRFHTPLAEKDSRLIIIGHSFGGAAVFSAVSQYVETVAMGESQAAELEGDDRVAKIRGYGDLVVLVNPAFEALLYDGLNRLTREIKEYVPDQHVVLMTVGADNDLATGMAFPVGQFLGRWYQRCGKGQLKKITTTSANLDSYITHELRPADVEAGKANVVCGKVPGSIMPWQAPTQRPATNTWWSYLPEKPKWKLEETREPAMPIHHAFMTIRTFDKLIDGHNGIFRSVFVEFLRDFVIAQDLHGIIAKGPIAPTQPFTAGAVEAAPETAPDGKLPKRRYSGVEKKQRAY